MWLSFSEQVVGIHLSDCYPGLFGLRCDRGLCVAFIYTIRHVKGLLLKVGLRRLSIGLGY